jgi:hypothetical protein
MIFALSGSGSFQFFFLLLLLAGLLLPEDAESCRKRSLKGKTLFCFIAKNCHHTLLPCFSAASSQQTAALHILHFFLFVCLFVCLLCRSFKESLPSLLLLLLLLSIFSFPTCFSSSPYGRSNVFGFFVVMNPSSSTGSTR